MIRGVPFADSYATSRQQFRELASEATWSKAIDFPVHPVAGNSTENRSLEDLTIDVAYIGPQQPKSLLLLTSGVHGVEGFFGAAVILNSWPTLKIKFLSAEAAQASLGLLLIHALNPFGFAHRRRCNEANIDLNRNFLLPGQTYAGAPEQYTKLDSLLNPSYPPRRWDGFYSKAAFELARHGFSAMQQAIAGGQYDFPRGLFFGGKEPSATYRVLEEHLRDWIGNAEQLVHLDFHTGLGKWATHKLLIEEPAESDAGRWLRSTFGDERVRSPFNSASAYRTRGGIGTWCAHHLADRKYVYACAEFGTYSPIKVLAGLRGENQAYWSTGLESPQRLQAADRLKELFFPRSESWRAKVIQDASQLIRTAQKSMVQPDFKL